MSKNPLKKIKAEDFANHMQLLAKRRWKRILEPPVLDKILQLSECHPYYLNLLCDKLWDQEVLPSVKDVEKKWQACLSQQKDKLIADLEPLSAIQIKVLSTIALQDGVKMPNGKDFLDATGLALGAVQKALQYLLGRDFLYQTEGSRSISLVDPLLKLFIISHSGGAG